MTKIKPVVGKSYVLVDPAYSGMTLRHKGSICEVASVHAKNKRTNIIAHVRYRITKSPCNASTTILWTCCSESFHLAFQEISDVNTLGNFPKKSKGEGQL